MQDLGYELPRIPILGSWVNKILPRFIADSSSTATIG
jgi:hypothetical protein